MEISSEGKKELALALYLWKCFKSDGKMDIEIFKQMKEMAEYLGIKEELEWVEHTILVPIEIKFKN